MKRRKANSKRAVRLTPSQIKVLGRIYLTTDCSNGVWDWAVLHWTQAKIAEGMPRLVRFCDGVVSVDGDGFTDWDSRGRERIGRAYQLKRRGYEALTAHDPQGYPASERRRHVGSKP